LAEPGDADRAARVEHALPVEAYEPPGLAQLAFAAGAGGARAAGDKREEREAARTAGDGADGLVAEHERRTPRPVAPVPEERRHRPSLF